jgi:UDP-glucuronate 4-epimerase
MKYLVTGGAGFIGSHVVEKLLGKGDEVVVIDNFNDYYNPLFKERNIGIYANHPKVKVYRQDIVDLAELKKIFEQENFFDAIVHLAARAGVRASNKYPLEYVNTNLVGTTNLLELAKAHKIKNFIFASSSSVYGNQKKTPFAESDDVANPISVYAATKRSGELLGRSYNEHAGLNFWALRFFTVYGERGRPDMAPYMFTQSIHEDKELTRFGAGELKRDFTYIDDITDGIIKAVDKIGQLGGYEIFNLGNNQPITANEFI